MSENLKPLDYEPNRLYTFVARAWHGRNIGEHKPPKEVNRAAFADAVLGRFFDDSERFAGIDREARLQQGDYAIDYLLGKPFEQLQDDLDDLKVKETDMIEYALQVAGLGARSFRDENKPDESPAEHNGEIRARPIVEQKQLLEEIPHNLHDALSWLFERGYITKASHAKCLLLLFEQTETSADEAAQKAAKHWAARYLQEKLKNNGGGVPPTSRKYLEMIVDRTLKDSSSNAVSEQVSSLQKLARDAGKEIPESVIRQKIEESILVGVASFFGQYPIIVHDAIIRDDVSA